MRPEDAELVTEAKVLQLLDVAREAYDIVVDGHVAVLLRADARRAAADRPGADAVRARRADAEEREAEPADARDARLPGIRTSLVLNRVTPKVGLTKADVEGVLGLDVSFEIPNDPVVAPSVNSGAVAALVEGDSEFAQAVAVIADSIEPAGVPAVARAAETPKRRWLTPRRVLEGRAS